MSEVSKKSKIKVLMVASKLDVTGISTVIMNYCSHMNLSKFEMMIAAGEPISDIHREKCKALGELRLHIHIDVKSVLQLSVMQRLPNAGIFF